MTIALGINFGDFVLLAADTRTTFGRVDHIVSYTDESEKIQKTSFGLITGAGRTDLLDAVKNRLAKQEITNTNQIFEAIKEERRSLLVRFLITESDIELTGWVYSYSTVLNDAPKLRLDVVHPSLGEGLVRWEENKAAIICPNETSKKEANKIVAILNKVIKPSTEFTTVEESYRYHGQIIGKLIGRIQPKYPSVSRRYQIGIHKLDGSMSISPIIKIDGSPEKDPFG